MGLTGTTSWTGGTKSNGTTIQRYKRNSATKVSSYSNNGISFFTYHDYQNNEYGEGVEIDACGYCWFRVQTDSAGCASLSFHCTGASRNQSNNKLYCRLSDSSEWSKSGGEVASYSGGWKYTFSDAKLLPNTYYYVHIWGGSVRAYGTMTITGSGTYGEPGEIEANDTVFNSPINMSVGSVTDGARYTASVQLGESDAITLQTYTDPSVPSSATAIVESESITLGSVDSDIFENAVENESGTYEFSFAGTDWYLSGDIADLEDYGITVTGAPDEGDIISVEFTAEVLGGKNDSLTWTPLLNTYADDYPNQSTVPCVITISTYFDSALAGTKTKTVSVAFTQAQVGVEIDNTVFAITPKNTGAVSGFNGYIQNYSAITASFDETGVDLKNNATVAKWSVKFGNAEVIDIDDGVTTSRDSSIISGTTAVVLTVTDSRGFTASSTLTATITPYQPVTFTANVVRGNDQGVEADDGSNFLVTFSATYASVDNQNSVEVEFFLKPKSQQDYGSGIIITGGSTTERGTKKIYSKTNHIIQNILDVIYDVQIVVTDTLGTSALLSFVMQTQNWAFHIRNGGSGVAFGKASERDNELDIGSWKLTCGAISSLLRIDVASFSTLPKTILDEAITANHVVVRSELGNPNAQDGVWNVITADGSLTISGTILDSTTLRLVLASPGTMITA